MSLTAIFATLDEPTGAQTQQAFSAGHFRWTDELLLTPEMAKLAAMDAAWNDMAAAVGTDAFHDARMCFEDVRAGMAEARFQ